MNLLGFANLVSYNISRKGTILPMINVASDQYGYFENNKYKFEIINATSGYILNGNF